MSALVSVASIKTNFIRTADVRRMSVNYRGELARAFTLSNSITSKTTQNCAFMYLKEHHPIIAELESKLTIFNESSGKFESSRLRPLHCLKTVFMHDLHAALVTLIG